MRGFEDVTLAWDGGEHTVPSRRVMGLLRVIEDALIADSEDDAMAVLMDRRRRVPIAAAFEAALTYAGAVLSPGTVYLEVMDHLATGRSDHADRMFEATMTILAMYAPPVHAQILGGASGEGDTGKKSAAG